MKKIVSIVLIILLSLSITGCKTVQKTIEPSYYVDLYSQNHSLETTYSSDFAFAGLKDSQTFLYQDLCFLSTNLIPEGSYDFSAVSAAAYDIDKAQIIYAKDIFERVYPASTTKLLTALVAVRYANLDDIVYIKEDNCGINIAGAQLCGFKAGDSIVMRDLLYCLLIYSGNDAAVAIAEHISGSVEEYCNLMNSEAAMLGATDTHFTNPHGLQDKNHYTTAYDIYLIFNECLKLPFFKEVFKTTSYTASIISADGSVREVEFAPTNYYAKGLKTAPADITVYGGKTGETYAAKNCLIIYSEDEGGHGFITELFRSTDRNTVYEEMNILLQMCVDSLE